MRISNLLKSLVISASLALGLASAANAAPWTVTFSGVSDYGYSYDASSNYTNLSGQAYSLSFTLDPAAYQYQYANNYPGYYSEAYGYGSLSGTANISLNVGSFSKSYTLDLSQYNNGQAELFDGDPTGYYNYTQTYQYETGYTAGGQYVYAYAYLYSYINAVNAGTDFNQVFTSTGSGGYGYANFNASGPDGYSYLYDYNPTTVTINGGGNVPEPMSLSLVALGLLGAAATRRKKQNA